MDITAVLKKLTPILGPKETRRAWEQLQIADPRTAKLLEFSLRKKLADATGSAFEEREALLQPIPEDKALGPIKLGTVHYGRRPLYEFGLRPEELIQHAAIFGRSGAGKTNVAFLLLRELSRLGIPFLVCDWKKNYRDALAIEGFKDLVVYTVGRDQAPFFFNPLIPPPGVEPREWLKKLIEICQHSYYLGEGVAFLLQEVIDQLYREFGVYESSGKWPTFRDLQADLLSRPVKGREASWMESTLRAVGVLNFGAMDWVLNSGAIFPIDKLLCQQAVLELDALTNSDKTFLIESLLLWIHHYRMNQPGRERLKHVLLIEEAHHILLKGKSSGAESVVDVVLREIRELGEAVIWCDQVPSMVSLPALENTFTTIAMNLKERSDVTAAAKAMLLETDEARHLGRLPVGWGMVKLQARWPSPFLVKFPVFRVRKGLVTDGKVHERYKNSLEIEEACRIMKDSSEAMIRLANEIVPAVSAGELPDPTATGLEEEALAFLKDIADEPTSRITDRYSRLDLNPKKGTKLVGRLEDGGLVRSVSVPIPGSHVRLLDLTRAGRETLGLPASETRRRGGLEHRYWIDRIARELEEAGIPVEKEAPIGEGKTVDLLVTKDSKRIAIEVETGKSDWKENVKKCVLGGVSQVVTAMTRPVVQETSIGPGHTLLRVDSAARKMLELLCNRPRETHPFKKLRSNNRMI